jgi:hypothetical protein
MFSLEFRANEKISLTPYLDTKNLRKNLPKIADLPDRHPFPTLPVVVAESLP